jgi:hypothetical protein
MPFYCRLVTYLLIAAAQIVAKFPVSWYRGTALFVYTPNQGLEGIKVDLTH